jgi:hypothetical protein
MSCEMKSYAEDGQLFNDDSNSSYFQAEAAQRRGQEPARAPAWTFPGRAEGTDDSRR